MTCPECGGPCQVLIAITASRSACIICVREVGKVPLPALTARDLLLKSLERATRLNLEDDRS